LFPLNETHKALLLGAALFVAVIVLFSILKGCNGAVTDEETEFNDDAFQSYVQKGAYENAMNEIIKNKSIINRDTTHYYNILRTTMFNCLLSSLKSQSNNKKEEFVGSFFKVHHQVLQRLGCEKEEELNYKNIAFVYRALQDTSYTIKTGEDGRIQDALNRNPKLLTQEELKSLKERMTNIIDIYDLMEKQE